jgi:hypothetical protein
MVREDIGQEVQSNNVVGWARRWVCCRIGTEGIDRPALPCLGLKRARLFTNVMQRHQESKHAGVDIEASAS